MKNGAGMRFAAGTLLGAMLAGLVVFLIAVLAAGCGGTVMQRYYQSVSQTYAAASTCYRSASAYNVNREAEIAAQARIDRPAARAARDEWRPQYAKIRKACDGLAGAAGLAEAAAPSVEAGTNKERDAAGWIARLMALAAEAAKVLSDAGIPLAGGVP